MNRRNLSGIYLFHKFDDEDKQEPTCFEDLPLEKQEEWLNSLSNEGLKSLALQLANNLRKIGDAFDIIAE